MATLQQTIKAVVRPGEDSGYVAECVEIAVVTQGRTLDETVANLREAVGLHLEGEDPASFGLRPNPTLILTLELEPSHARAFVGSRAAKSFRSSNASGSNPSPSGAATSSCNGKRSPGTRP